MMNTSSFAACTVGATITDDAFVGSTVGVGFCVLALINSCFWLFEELDTELEDRQLGEHPDTIIVRRKIAKILIFYLPVLGKLARCVANNTVKLHQMA